MLQVFLLFFCRFFSLHQWYKDPRLLIHVVPWLNIPCLHWHVLAMEINQVQLDQPGRRSVEIPIHSPEEAKADKSGKSEVSVREN